MRELLFEDGGHVLPGQRVVEAMAVPLQTQLATLHESLLKTATSLEPR